MGDLRWLQDPEALANASSVLHANFYRKAEQKKAVLGIINHFIFKALIFWEKVKFLLGFEN